MKVVVCLGVKDEVEFIEKTIAQLRSVGVDLIIACDMYSTDGSAELLAQHRGEADFWFFQMSDGESQEQWTRRNMELVRKAAADWVMFLDADEYLIPASGNIKDTAALHSADIVSLNRFNVVLSTDGPCVPARISPDRFDDLLLIAEPIPDYWAHVQVHPETPWMMQPLAPRFVARPQLIGDCLPPGAHDVLPLPGISVRRAVSRDLFAAHLPFTTARRFARKVENVRKIFQVHDKYFVEGLARHWRRWAAMGDSQQVEEEFRRMIFDADTISDLRKRGVIRSAAEVFASRAPEGIP